MILIKLRKKLLASTAVGAALILSAVLIVSMTGNDKPSITTNPPPTEEEQPPASAPESPGAETEVPTTPEEPEEEENEQPGDEGDEPAPEHGKATGLARAYEVHLRNLERMQEKLAAKGMAVHSADSYPHGLVHSTMKLAEKLGIEADLGFTLEKVDVKGHGNGKGNAYGLDKT
ncbi:MAG: hypothetical protein ACUVT7_00390 [Thermoplasmata archaeon]